MVLPQDESETIVAKSAAITVIVLAVMTDSPMNMVRMGVESMFPGRKRSIRKKVHVIMREDIVSDRTLHLSA